MREVKVGQVFLAQNHRAVHFVITGFNRRGRAYIVYANGNVSQKYTSDVVKCTLLAEYPTWKEAVNSKEFSDA
jgi:hypothetical protein